MTQEGPQGRGSAPVPSAQPEKDLSFERALARLEELVARLEKGDLPLEETITAFEEGQKMLRICQDLLGRAELRVKEVLRRADGTLEQAEWKEGSDGARS